MTNATSVELLRKLNFFDLSDIRREVARYGGRVQYYFEAQGRGDEAAVTDIVTWHREMAERTEEMFVSIKNNINHFIIWVQKSDIKNSVS